MTDARACLAAMETTWPPVRSWRKGPWRLRAGGGGGKRVSAATVEARPLEADIDLAESGMIDAGQRPLFMLRDGDERLDDRLALRDYRVVDPVALLACPARRLVRPLPPVVAIPAWPPLAIQRDIWARGGIDARRIAVMERAGPPKVAILGRLDDRPAGTVFAAVSDGIAMVHALEVDLAERRRGVGATLMAAAAAWADDKGARTLALAVTRANEAALALYRAIGLNEITGYHYRAAPGDIQ